MTLHQKVIAVYGLLRGAINGRMSKYDVAREFDETKSYPVGRLVIHGDSLWRCTTAHSGPWDSNDFERSTIDEAVRYEVDNAVIQAAAAFVAKTDIADEFSKYKSYDTNRLVIYNDVVYRCKVAHPAGDWIGSDFEEATIDDVIRLNGGLKNIADEFSTSETYAAGQLVLHDNKLYRCREEHTGDWVASRFIESTVADALAMKASVSDIEELEETLSGKASVSKVEELEEALSRKASTGDLSSKIGLDTIASDFSEGSYSVGQLVKYNGKLYRCTRAHTGPWGGGTDFIESPVSGSVNLMATKDELSERDTAIGLRALKSELGYSGNSYSCDMRGHDEIDLEDMGIAVLHLYDSGSSESLGEIVVNLPQVSQEGESGAFHATKCMLVVDALDIHDEMPSIVLNGGNNCLKLWTGMSDPYYANTVSMIKLTYLGTINGDAAWFCDDIHAQIPA